MSKNAEVYEAVTEQILAELESGNAPWRMPWVGNGGIPQNLVSKRPYRGINAFLLGMLSMHHGSPYWLTYKQASELGGNVRKGEKSTIVMFWKEIMVKDEAAEGGKRKVLMARTYRVFNVMQCDGLEDKIPAVETGEEFDPVAAAEEILANVPNPPTLEFGGSAAFYVPSKDHVQLPKREQFKSVGGYYNTMFHEFGHATGHESRLDREGVMGKHRFGSKDYSAEELVAELTACFVSAEAGITPDVPQSAAYCKSWLKVLKDDRKMLVQAASKAAKAADYLMGRLVEPATD
jgi:antirestriction protein ArdC